jgi:hypothetical protein
MDVKGHNQAMTETSRNSGVTWSNAQPARFAAGMQNSSGSDNFNSVSCSSSTCVAAGSFMDVKGHNQAMTETSRNSGVTWSNAQPARFAAGMQNSSGSDNFNSVSCSSSTCVAAGNFTGVNFYHFAMTETSRNGGVTWANVQPVIFAGGFEYSPSSLVSVSCSSSTCMAVGSYTDARNNGQAMMETSSDGGVTWSNARPANYVASVRNAAPDDSSESASCSSLTCVAAGVFLGVKSYIGMTERP